MVAYPDPWISPPDPLPVILLPESIAAQAAYQLSIIVYLPTE